METQEESRGLPIYRDPIDRQLPDPALSNETDWHPATASSSNLWRCFEAMQKMCFLLDGISKADQSETKVRRFLIQFAVPLDDFFVCVLDLSKSIEGDSQTRDRLTDDELKYVRELQKRYGESVLKNNRPLKNLRNKLGAHTDKGIYPGEAAALVKEVDIRMVGSCLCAALLVLDKLAHLDCFSWSSKGYSDGEVRLMTPSYSPRALL